MWREVDDQGFLVNSFIDSVAAMHPMYVIRAVGGVLYLAGGLIMAWNLWKTVVGAAPGAPTPRRPVRASPAAGDRARSAPATSRGAKRVRTTAGSSEHHIVEMNAFLLVLSASSW